MLYFIRKNYELFIKVWIIGTRMNRTPFFLIWFLTFAGIITLSNALIYPVFRDDSDDNNDNQFDDMILTEDQIDAINKETEPSNRETTMNTTYADDMILTQEQIDIINGGKEAEDRGIAPSWAKHWNFKDKYKPGKVIVPYKLDYKFSDVQKNWIKRALKEIEAVSCIRYHLARE